MLVSIMPFGCELWDQFVNYALVCCTAAGCTVDLACRVKEKCRRTDAVTGFSGKGVDEGFSPLAARGRRELEEHPAAIAGASCAAAGTGRAVKIACGVDAQ